jgi:hypothetical protein
MAVSDRVGARPNFSIVGFTLHKAWANSAAAHHGAMTGCVARLPPLRAVGYRAVAVCM